MFTYFTYLGEGPLSMINSPIESFVLTVTLKIATLFNILKT